MFAISIDSPAQHSAMIEKLSLPYPMLSDPDRGAAITPYGLADENNPRELARPAIVLVGPDGTELFRRISRDFADRLPEDDLMATLDQHVLPATEQLPPTLGPIEAGPKAMPMHAMPPYFRGARFAAVAFGRRHPDIHEDTDGFVAQMDRYGDAVRELRAAQKG